MANTIGKCSLCGGGCDEWDLTFISFQSQDLEETQDRAKKWSSKGLMILSPV